MSSAAAPAQIVAFRLGQDLFAADIFAVERVLRFSEPRKIPNVPDWIEGVLDYQKRVVPVIDLRKRFELHDTTISGLTRLIVLDIQGDFIAAIVDEVLDVMHLGAARMSSPPPIFRGLSADFLVGMARRNDRLVVILDFARIFSTNERLVLETMRTGEKS